MIRDAICFLLCAVTLQAQSLLDIHLGGKAGQVYSVTQWKKDWPGCEFEDGVKEGRVTLIRHGQEPWLRVLYPAGSHGSDAGGAGWRCPFGRVEAAELRYTVQFQEAFDFVKGGKLPGLCGGPKTITGGDAVNGRDGFSARVMWRRDGRGQAYVYHMHQPSKYGDEFDFPEAFRFVPGKPVAIRMQVVMNHAGQRDGSLRVWADDQLMVEKKDLQWRESASYGVDSLLFNTFHGGSDASWAPSRDVWAEFSRFQVQRMP